jgi:(p)ppGpp synthase/HD superfamily hydrolase
MVAIRVHAGQTDKQGEPYLLHILRVIEGVSDEAKVVAALHDVSEDSGLDLIDVPFALSHREIDAIELLTKLPAETYAEYIDHIAMAHTAAGLLAREVKLADLRDNLGRIPPLPSKIPTIKARPEWLVKWDREWEAQWGSLKARYEKAIATLEATG